MNGQYKESLHVQMIEFNYHTLSCCFMDHVILLIIFLKILHFWYIILRMIKIITFTTFGFLALSCTCQKGDESFTRLHFLTHDYINKDT